MSQTNRLSALRYQPALDGVRAVSVVMVLLFHAGFSWMGGGYLGVSVFFTLSGFLITTLLLVEHERTDAVSFRRFYSRRIKRLLPASLLCLLAIVIAYWSGEFRFVPNMRGQLWGSLGQIYNWVQIEGSSSYADLFGQAPAVVSPLEHYWSLAIEEQFYIVWPVTAWLVIRRCRRRGTDAVRAMLLLTAVCAVAAPILTSLTSPKFGYWSTPTRLGELLVGASAAAWHHRGGRLPSWSRWMALVAVGVLALLAMKLPVGAGPAYTGWMTPIALVSGALILSLQVPGQLRSLLSLTPVVWLGRVSYGVYLFHWPVFVLLRVHGWQLDRPFGFGVALSITLAIAALSFYLVEQPVREAVWRPRVTFVTASLGAAFISGAIVLMPVSRGFLEPNQQALDQAAIETLGSSETLAPLEVTTSTGPSMTGTPTSSTLEPLTIPLPAEPNRPVRILLVGDSTASSVGQGMAAWAVANPGYAQLDILWCAGCAFLRGGRIVNFDGGEEDSARVVGEELPRRVKNLSPDVVVLMTSIDDIATREWSSEEGPLTPFDALFRQRMLDSYTALTNELLAQGVQSVVWIVPPVPIGQWPTPELHDRDRYLVQHEVILELVNAKMGRVSAVDLDQWMTRGGHLDDDWWRPDGTHFSEEAALQLTTEYLGPRLVITALAP